MSTQSQPAIRLQNVSKRFAFTPDMPQSVLETAIDVFSRRRRHSSQALWAVHDVSFEIMPGQCVGIVGRNGSGKSTLLKLIARIIQPTSGEILVSGRVSALLELGAGFHPDLTGRENIYLNASVLGLSRDETETLFADIVDFSELGEFIDMPVKHYSSGMYMRLGFSVAIHVRPDILIVDEILAVGDQNFQTKCMDRIMEMKRNGVTILFISHDLTNVAHLCSDVVWLDHGVVRMVGPTDHVLAHYRSHLFNRADEQMSAANDFGSFRRWGTMQIEITDVRLLNGTDEPTTIFRTGDALTVEIAYTAHEPIEEPEFGLALHRQDGVHVSGPNTRAAGLRLGVVAGSGRVRYAVPRLPLLPGRYNLTVAVHDSVDPIAYDYHEEAYSFRVVEGGTDEKEGLLALDASWAYSPARDTAPAGITSASGISH
ncbi:MAG TPA: ABC transporter ATP-binding protein [Promineifilum sp.]|nr:ABC transporter ATP-binding protein [Promineifilum sp.]